MTASDDTTHKTVPGMAAPTSLRRGDAAARANATPVTSDAQARPAPTDDARADAPARPKTSLGWIGLQLARAVLPVLVIAGAVAAYQYLYLTRQTPAQQTPTETRFPVAALTAEPADIRPKLNLFGNALSGREVELRALVAGRVIDTASNFRDGARIERESVLLTIDPFDYESAIAETTAQITEARARVEELKASIAVEEGGLKFARDQLEIGRADLARAERLARRGNISDRALDERRLTVSQRQQAVTQSENNLKVQRARVKQQEAAIVRLQATAARNQQRLTETKLKAPFSGYLTSVNAQVGRMVSSNDQVATLIDRDQIDVKFTLSDNEYGRLAGGEESALLGRAVQVRWDVGGKPVTYRATVDRIAARVQSTTGGVDVFARVSEPESGRVALRPGAFVGIRLDDILFSDVLSVPPTAVYDRKRVYLIEDGRLKAQPITIVGTDGDRLLVTGDIARGAQIATTRLSVPGTGVAVTVR
ncbi:MAG: efflux RND transporter periplasmic adaptor subunit [Pseudomonadota bacterium]